MAQDSIIGIEFIGVTKPWVDRAIRIPTHQAFTPQLSGKDPLDPNRMMFLLVLNVSDSGLLLSTSLTNKHLFPGMILKDCLLHLPGQDNQVIDLTIENARECPEPGMFWVGTSFRSISNEARAAIKQYLSILAPASSEEDQMDAPSHIHSLSKKVKHGLSFSVVTTKEQYEAVLKLRFTGYKHHGKIKKSSSWMEQGDGLAEEGTIISASLGGQVIASMEIRFGKDGRPLRVEKMGGDAFTANFDRDAVAELNKFVVHPKAQGSDIVVGMMQKAHAILVAKGGFDLIITATDKLVALYERIGFVKTGHTLPHPHVDELKLNIMLMKKEVYLEAKNINPYSWTLVYEASQQHLERLGVAKQVKLSPWQKAIKTATPMLLSLQNKRRKAMGPAGERRARDRGHDTTSKVYTNPLMTSQDMIAPVLYPYILEADLMIGRDKVDRIIASTGLNRDYFSQQSNWISVAFLNEFLEQFGQSADIAELSKKAAERSLHPDVIGLKYHVLKHFMSPDSAFQAFERLLPRFNRTRIYKLVSRSRGRAKVSIGVVSNDLLPKHRASCLNWEYTFHAYLKLMTGRPGQVRKTSCCYDGHDACVYEINWHAKRILPQKTIRFALAAIPLALVFDTINSTGDTGNALLVTSLFGLGILALYYYYTSTQQNIENKSLTRHFEQYEAESSERYSELQRAKLDMDQRFREAQLLESTAKSIQELNDLTSILNVTLNSICTSFGLDRAFVMLRDEKKEKLTTAAVSGLRTIPQEGIHDLWSFSVDISTKRNNPMLLSSVYHFGQPMLIDDVETHLFQLNDSSQRLINQLGSRGFVMVPIPSDSGTPSQEKNLANLSKPWGVLIADKYLPGKALNKFDLVLLQRVAQHLGLSLDKQAKLDREADLRRFFQKYVPADIAGSLTTSSAPALGGQLRDVVCMFMDIRGFTQTSEGMSPQRALNYVNQLFEIAQKYITKNNGIIDKFLGDGLFATWGTFGKVVDPCSKAVAAAMDVLTQLPELNNKLTAAGFPSISIGMGIAYGEAVVGNVGSEERMEFTCIGPCVNLASRLEGLCKNLEASLVIDGSVLDLLSNDQKEFFQVHENLTVRGLEKTRTVASIPVLFNPWETDVA